MRINSLSLNAKLALALAVSLMLWMLTGVVTQHREKSATDAAQEQAPEFAVRVQTSEAVDYQPRILLRARTEAKRRILVAAQIDGQVIDTPVQEGQAVEQGAALCVLNPEDRNLQWQQALAQRDKAQIDYDGALKLKGGGLQSQSQIAAAKASLAIADAQVKAASIARDNLIVRAPFDGVLQERLVDVGAFLTRGAPCAKLIELSPLLVVGNVAEADLASLSLGAAARVVFLDKAEQQGVLTYISRAADPVTRTFKVEIEIANAGLALAEGLSADAEILARPRPAHLIAPSLLSLLDEGKVGVKIVDEKNQVHIKEVTLLGDDPAGVWVSGLPDLARVIRVGQEYVTAGSIVRVADSNADSSLIGHKNPADSATGKEGKTL